MRGVGMQPEHTFEVAGRRFDSGWLIAGAFCGGILVLAAALGGFVVLRHGLSGAASEPIQIAGSSTAGQAAGLTNSGAAALAPPPIPDKPINVEDYKPQLAM